MSNRAAKHHQCAVSLCIRARVTDMCSTTTDPMNISDEISTVVGPLHAQHAHRQHRRVSTAQRSAQNTSRVGSTTLREPTAEATGTCNGRGSDAACACGERIESSKPSTRYNRRPLREEDCHIRRYGVQGRGEEGEKARVAEDEGSRCV